MQDKCRLLVTCGPVRAAWNVGHVVSDTHIATFTDYHPTKNFPVNKVNLIKPINEHNKMDPRDLSMKAHQIANMSEIDTASSSSYKLQDFSMVMNINA